METKPIGEKITTVGAVLLALSIVLPIFGLRGPAINPLYGVVGLIGLVLGVVGMFMWRVLKR
jgi:hypothetical protein